MILEDYDLPNIGAGGGRWQYETDPRHIPNPRGFDQVAATICFRGTLTQLYSLYDLGAQNVPSVGSGRDLYYTGPQVIESRLGYHVADLIWTGYATPALNFNGLAVLPTGVRINSIDLNASPEESLFPQERDGITVILQPPFSPPGNGIRQVSTQATGASTLTLGWAPWRIRLLAHRYSYSVRGAYIATRNSTFKPPTLNLPNPYTGDPTAINWQSLPDPLVTYAEGLPTGGDGWWCATHRFTSEFVLGDRKLQFWEGEYEWVRRYGP